MSNNSGESRKPIKTLKIGLLSVSIFAREMEKWTAFSVNFSRAYKDAGDWKYTDSFAPEDLPVIEKLSEGALRWILNEQAKER